MSYTISDLPLGELFPSPNNPRTVLDDDPSIIELASSLKDMGLIQPIVVRLVDVARYEILAGHRRFAAARVAGLPTIQARVLDECDDRRALEITVVENLQRQDLAPLEEAHGVAALLDGGWDVADIASHLGKSERWVYLRAKLRDLSPAWRKALADPKRDARKMTAGALELIARHRKEDQDQILERYFGKASWEDDHAEAVNMTVAEWQAYLSEHFTHDLKKAKWDLDDVKLVPSAGACSACPHRTSCQLVLFEMARKGGDDRCLNEDCWKAKHAAWLTQREAELKAKHPELQRVTTDYASDDNLPRVNKYGGDLKPVAKTSPKAVPVMAVDGSHAGQLVWVEPRGNSAKAKSVVNQAKPKSDKVKRAEARERWLGSRAKSALRHWGEWLDGDAGKQHPCTPPKESGTIMSLILLAAQSQHAGVVCRFDFVLGDFVKLEVLSGCSWSVKAWEYVAAVWSKSLTPESATLDRQLSGWRDVVALAHAAGLGAEITRIEDTVRAEVPIPKRLAPFFDAATGEPIADAPTDAKKPGAAKPKGKKAAHQATTKVTAKKPSAAKPKAAAKTKAKAQA